MNLRYAVIFHLPVFDSRDVGVGKFSDRKLKGIWSIIRLATYCLISSMHLVICTRQIALAVVLPPLLPLQTRSLHPAPVPRDHLFCFQIASHFSPSAYIAKIPQNDFDIFHYCNYSLLLLPQALSWVLFLVPVCSEASILGLCMDLGLVVAR